NLIILILIAVLAAIGAIAGLHILSWFFRAFFNVAIFILAIIGILFLLKNCAPSSGQPISSFNEKYTVSKFQRFHGRGRDQLVLSCQRTR
ncbi:hypothetical protein MEO41_28945, partial [Dolichospermum sp. ST_sed4]|nr:hypothetical protein [Dolichospermum sp. ST_sed4]